MLKEIFLFVLTIQNILSLRYISDQELKDFCEKALAADRNNVARFITLNLQGKSRFGEQNDLAPEKLMTVAKEAYHPTTIAKVLPLYNNYDADSTKEEVLTKEEKEEETMLIDALLGTEIMALAKKLLQSKEMVPDGENNFKTFISDLWFTIFSRGGRKKGSSAFEHIFLGEFKKGNVSGLHSWIFFDHEEKAGRLNYFGWSKKIDLPGNKGSIVKVKYSWNGILKPTGTMFIGTSPEFEIALYTICFLARPNDRCNISVGGKSFFIHTYSFKQNDKLLIGSAYPGL